MAASSGRDAAPTGTGQIRCTLWAPAALRIRSRRSGSPSSEARGRSRQRSQTGDSRPSPTITVTCSPIKAVREQTAQQVNSSYHRQVAFPSELGNSTSSQLHGISPALLIPVGSTEQHGPHLPLDTDTRIASAVARRVAEGLAEADHHCGWMIAPPIGYGASGEHESFSGTVSIGSEALRLLLVEFGR